MNFLSPDAHSAVLCADTFRLAEILWHLLKAERLMSEKCQILTKEGMFERSEPTEFGEEVGRATAVGAQDLNVHVPHSASCVMLRDAQEVSKYADRLTHVRTR
jgi:hypothetical protein